MERILTCIICPRGCEMTVALDGGDVKTISGNACQRGAKYAADECKNPLRSVTSTVRCESGYIVPVKTAGAVPKSKIFDCMEEINKVVAPDGLCVGDVVIPNILDTGIDVIVTGKATR